MIQLFFNLFKTPRRLKMTIDDPIETLQIEYAEIDGWHVYTSPDLFGLYVANPVLEMAYNAVPANVERLICLNKGKTVTAKWTQRFGAKKTSIQTEPVQIIATAAEAA